MCNQQEGRKEQKRKKERNKGTIERTTKEGKNYKRGKVRIIKRWKE